MFAKTFPVVSPLHAVEVAIRAEVCAINQFALGVEVQSPRIAAALAEKLELVRQRMITPNALLKFEAANVCGDGAALASVQPAVRPPGKGIGDRMRVFHAEASEAHNR